MKKERCPGCGKRFENSQGLGSHKNYCQRLKERLAGKVEWPAEPARDAEKRERSPLTWGIAPRGGKWQPVPIINGMTYEAAVRAADNRNRIPPVRRSRPLESAADDDDTGKALLLLLMNLRR